MLNILLSNGFFGKSSDNWIDNVLNDLINKNTATFSEDLLTDVENRLQADYIMPDASDNYYTRFGPGSVSPINDSSWFLPFELDGDLLLTSNEKTGDDLIWDFGDEIIEGINTLKTISSRLTLMLVTTDNWTGMTNLFVERTGQPQGFTGIFPCLNSLDPELLEVHGANCGFTDISESTFTNLFHWCIGNNTFEDKQSPIIIAPLMEEFYYVDATWSEIRGVENYSVLEYLRLENTDNVSGAVPISTSNALYRLDIQRGTYQSMVGTVVHNALYINCYSCTQMSGSFPDIECNRAVGLNLLYGYNSPFTDFEEQSGTPFGSNTQQIRFDGCAISLAGLTRLLTALDIPAVTNLTNVRINGGTNAVLDANALALVSSIEARNSGLTILHN